MSGCLLAKFNLGLSVITVIVYAIAFASPYWIQKDFSLDVPGYIMGLPPPLNDSMIPVTVSSNMGILASCDDINVWIPGLPGPRNSMDCDADGAKDWQYSAAGCGIAGLVIAVLCLALSTAILFLDRRPYYNKLRVTTVVCYFLAAIFVMVPIILYGTKLEFQVKPPLPHMEEYHLFWAFWVAIGSDIMFAVLAALHLLQILFSTQGMDGIQKDPGSSYKMDYKSTS